MATTKIITEVTDLNAASSTNGLKMPTGTAYSGTPTDGMMRNDTTGSSQGSASTMQHYNGTEWKNFENLSSSFSADFLVVAGGGGGGPNHGGGGGAGGYIYTTGASLSAAVPYSLDVGIGGDGSSSGFAGDSGGDSTFNITTATGGGGGGYNNSTGVTGGSGGGGSRGAAAGSGTSGQGNSGGTGGTFSAGGGGGASAAGSNGSTYVGGNGGAGTANSITGTSVFYAGGGGGNGYTASGGTGGVGGGGNGGQYGGGGEYIGTNGALNTGGGGGGSYSNSGTFQLQGMNGGSGIVILRYPTASVSSYAVTGTLDTTTDTAYPVANSAYYKLNGDALDSSGNGYNGTWNGTETYAAGRFGQAAVFNGVNQTYVKLPSAVDTILNTKNFGLSLWVKAPNAATDAVFSTETTNSTFQIHANWGFAGAYALINGGGSDINLGPVDSNWHHIVVTSDGSSSYKGYFDGVYKGASTYRQIANTGTFLGAHQSGGFTLNGQIDQVRIFNSQLNQTQITQLFNEGTVNESTDGTDSILQFIGGTGTVTFS